MARALGVIRLSRDTDESTSVARQRTYIAAYAEQHGHEVVGFAEDLDVSGSVSPFDRPELGRWLATPDEYDVLIAWRLDRITRRLLHLATLIEWCRDRGKDIATTSEGFDMATPMGRVFVQILGALAEGELEAIRERAAASSRHLITTGRWRGGIIPYGYRVARTDAGSWLEIDPPAAEVVRDIARRVIDGESANSVTRTLNDAGVPTPMNVQRARAGKPLDDEAVWHCPNVLRLLRSHTLLGLAEMTEKVKAGGRSTKVITLVRGDDGLPLQRAEPILERHDWDALQAKLAAKGSRSPSRGGGSLLLRVAFCECGEALYQNSGRSVKYYRCSSHSTRSRHCGNPSIAAEELEHVVVELFMTLGGGEPAVNRTFVPGDGRAGMTADVERSMNELLESQAAGVYSSELGRRAFHDAMTSLNARALDLEANPPREGHWIEEPTGETYREKWMRLSTIEQRNAELRACGVRATLHHEPFDAFGDGWTSRVVVAVGGLEGQLRHR